MVAVIAWMVRGAWGYDVIQVVHYTIGALLGLVTLWLVLLKLRPDAW